MFTHSTYLEAEASLLMQLAHHQPAMLCRYFSIVLSPLYPSKHSLHSPFFIRLLFSYFCHTKIAFTTIPNVGSGKPNSKILQSKDEINRIETVEHTFPEFFSVISLLYLVTFALTRYISIVVYVNNKYYFPLILFVITALLQANSLLKRKDQKRETISIHYLSNNISFTFQSIQYLDHFSCLIHTAQQ